METLGNVATAKRARDKYVAVNGAWPRSLPLLTAAEAVSAFRQLYRYRFNKRYTLPVKSVRGAHRRTWTDGGKMIVSPDQGWHDFIHDLSHWIHRKQYPGQNPHKGSSHAAVEKDLIEKVVNSGWLDGRLKRKRREVAPKVKDVKAARLASIEKRIKSWMTKAKCADTALRKLKRQKAYYARQAMH